MPQTTVTPLPQTTVARLPQVLMTGTTFTPATSCAPQGQPTPRKAPKKAQTARRNWDHVPAVNQATPRRPANPATSTDTTSMRLNRFRKAGRPSRLIIRTCRETIWLAYARRFCCFSDNRPERRFEFGTIISSRKPYFRYETRYFHLSGRFYRPEKDLVRDDFLVKVMPQMTVVLEVRIRLLVDVWK